MQDWQTLERPGFSGKNRNRKRQEWDQKYGQGKWRLAWLVGETYVDFLGACALYEDAYFHFLQENHDILYPFIKEASDVYDDEPSNVSSRFDYSRQETIRTHIQDIAIRRSLIRMGLWFHGNSLIRIREEKGTYPFSWILSPGRVPFHMHDLIHMPELKGWWGPGSVESFYQSNKFLQIKIADAIR